MADSPVQWPGTPVGPVEPQWPGTPQVGVGEDIAQTAIPSAERGIAALMTTVPSLWDLAAKGIEYGAKKVLPESISGAMADARKTVEDTGKMHRYQDVQSNIEKSTGPLYQAQTGPGKVAQTAIEFAPSAMGGSGNLIGNIAKGAGAGATSELAGQAAENAGYKEYAPWARFGGAFLGGAIPTMARRTVTPFPASDERTNFVNLLNNKIGSGMPMTAGQKTGSPFLQGLEGQNMNSVAAPNWIKTLPEQQAAGFTKGAMSSMGSPASDASAANLRGGVQNLSSSYDPLIKNSEVIGAPFDALQKSLGDIRKNFTRVAGTDKSKALDEVVNDIKHGAQGPQASSTVASIPGERYQYLRQSIANKIETATTPSEKNSLVEMRSALDKAMSDSLPAEQAAKLKELNTQWANSQIIKDSVISPEGTISPKDLGASVLRNRGREAYNLDKAGELGPYARAGESVLKIPEAPPHGSHPIAHTAGALIGGAPGFAMGGVQGAEAGGVLGMFALPHMVDALRQNPVTARLLFNKGTQGYLGNQNWMPNSATTMDPQLVARLLATAPGNNPPGSK